MLNVLQQSGRAKWRSACRIGLLWMLLPLAAGAQVERAFEDVLMQQLAQLQDEPDNLAPFTTDGCSGGLSAAWRSLARALPGFREKYGMQPPWQACCVDHDRVYWRGPTENGFERRKAADLKLKQCVMDTGRRLTPRWMAQHELSPAHVTEAFAAAAELMYSAVRVGGLPCTPFPWRWGYGWPPCPILEQSLAVP
ncbi:hypothetical protein Tel_14520 [Candidatus Tenderia electrophaga]|jgi:hypothetical protein|uniref:Phospholipase A2 domain-containing protein n=1 Tax=Candidatus Tenderia electrophaga TaxID=1748243 RepID=A0A0S2TGL2_9GAMM|nr:hypothetical protein Tel_14520 [Candidatus Tenderia electrophaga]